MAIVKGTKENFEAEVLKANGVVVVDFGANWCGPCKSLVPILDEVVEEDPNKKIVKEKHFDTQRGRFGQRVLG